MGADYIKYIVKNDLCTRCGMCAGVCPKNVFAMNRQFLPEIVSDQCIDCGLCSDCCPGQNVDFQKLAEVAESDKSEYHEFTGHYLDYLAGYSTDPNIRSKSSSGGVVTALLKYLLDEKMVQRAVVAKVDPDRPCCFKPTIVTQPDELVAASGSKYSFVNTCAIIKDVIKEEGKTAIVALPCQVHALRKYMAKVPASKGKIIIIGLACASAMPPEATYFILNSNHIEPNGVSEVRYRSGLWPGQWVAIFMDGSRTDLTKPRNHKYVFKILNRLFPVPRCLLCSDGYNEFSDISVSDPWFAIKAGTDRYIDDRGWSLVIERTEKGRDIIEGAVKKDYIYLESISNQVAPDQVTQMLIEKKRYVPLRIQRQKIKGKPIPDYNLHVPKPTIRIRYHEWKNWIQYYILRHKLSRRVVAALLKHKL